MTFKHILYCGAAACILTACTDKVSSVESHPETSTTETSEFKLDYEKFTLDNGLEVILHVDKSDPIVALTTVIHAGSNREKPGRTGFAHFFEHMAFNDSENVPRGWNRKAIPDWGGQRNGGTWSDGTIYFEVVPKDAFDKILWIDSDRLGYMINTVTQDALEREKQVVKNEKRQRVDNAPYGYTGEVIRKNLYPEGHPYSWTVIGSLPDLQAATLDDLKEFYAQVYGPNNATLSIVGDIDIADTKRKVQQWFGEIPKGQDIEPLAPMPVVLDADKKLYFEDNFAKLPELRLTFPTVEGYHEDEQALEVLGQIIGGSKNSVLYKQIVETDKLAPNVGSFNNSSEIAGEFTFRIRANAATDLDDVYKSLQTALTTFEKTGVDAKDLQRIKAEQETILYSSISTVLGKSNQLASDNEFAGDPAFAMTAARRLNAVSADDVMAAYNKYLKSKPAVITSFVPKGQSELALENSTLAKVWIEEVKSGAANEEVSQGAEAQYEKTVTKFDRSEPPFGELPLVKMPDIWETKLQNNVPILGIENSETPLVNFDITINAGANNLETAQAKGKVMLLARLMNEGTALKTPAELEQAIGLLGSGINVRAGTEDFTISGTCLAKNFEATLKLVEEILLQPRFEQTDFDRVKSAALTSIKGREANANSIARLAQNKLIYGSSHPLGLPSSGTTQTVETLTLEDLQAVHSMFSNIDARIHIAGDIPKSRAIKAFEPIAQHINTGGFTAPNYDIPAQDNAGKVFFIDVPGSKQSVLSIGRLGVSATDLNYNQINFTNEKLGGGISGDLSQTLRIEKGYTYGAFSGMGTALTPQVLNIGTSVRANATQASLDVIKDMLINYGKDFDADDVELTQKKLIKENTRAFESLGAKLATLRRISKYGKSKKYVEDDQKELVNMSLEDFKNTAENYLNESDMVYVVVGDKETQLGPVQTFANESNKGAVTQLD
ncbi:MAG: pitrilysin family protein, partial [Litorimonas sp.]